MIRASQKWIIYLKDLASKMVQRKTLNWKGQTFIEYWIYKPKMEKTGLIYPHSLKPVMREVKDKAELKAIICCPVNHIRKKTTESILIEGVKFYRDEKLDESRNDIHEYLRRTGRSIIE